MAQLKNTTINDTGFLQLPSGTTAQRPASPAGGQIRYNTDINDTEYYDGAAWRPISDSNPEATGGTVVDTDIGGVPYRIHLFTATGNSTFTVSKGGEVEVLVVAGGGGGGGVIGGGGGGGGFRTETAFSITPGSAITVTVGDGGSGGFSWHSSSQRGNPGTDSIFSTITATGGGGGGAHGGNDNRVNGTTGGSGGGGGGGAGSAGNTPSTTPSQGNGGGTGGGNNGGGGGGASANGETGVNNVKGGDGGNGTSSSISGTSITYAGGGGGGTRSGNGIAGTGGSGGGGNGGTTDLSRSSTHGGTNTGGGGGAGGHNGSGAGAVQSGSNGGSGIVIVRYRRNASTTTQPDQTRPSFQPFFYARDVRPIIARDGLVLDLDAANPLSYPGTGTTWTDISNNGYTVSYSWQFNSGNFGTMDFDGNTDGFTGGWPGNQFSGPGSSRAWEAWVKPRSTSNQGIFGYKTGSGCSYYCNFGLYIYEGEYSINWYDNSTYRWLKTGISVQTNQWAHVVGTCIGDIPKIYLNGELMATFGTTNLNYAAPNGMKIWNIAWNDKNAGQDRFNGQIGVLRFYRPGLSLSQIQQNFNALRGRYGY